MARTCLKCCKKFKRDNPEARDGLCQRCLVEIANPGPALMLSDKVVWKTKR